MQIFLEYVMLARVNDNPEQAHELGKLLSHRPTQYMVNLIPWNPVYSPTIDFEAPDSQRLAAFHSIVRSYNLHCTVRREMGQEIAGSLLQPTELQPFCSIFPSTTLDCQIFEECRNLLCADGSFKLYLQSPLNCRQRFTSRAAATVPKSASTSCVSM